MKKLLTLALGLLLSTASWAGFEQCSQLFPTGKAPVVSETSIRGQFKELCFDAYGVLHSGQSKTPVYVVERLSRAQLLDAKDEERTNKFYAEARLPSAQRAQLEDYKPTILWAGQETHFDRGHMAPAADMPTAQAMAQSFSLANMVPQAPVNNRKVWSGIEKATRQYVMRAAGDVYVFSGPLYGSSITKLGPGEVWVPQALFKLVYDSKTRRAWVHLVENTDTAKAGRPLSYSDFVKRSGLNLLPAGSVAAE